MKEFLNLRSSQLSRFMSCSGVVDLPQESTSSKAADDGTAWHWVIEQILAGKKVELNMVAPNGVTVDEDMLYYANMVTTELQDKKIFNEYPISYRPSANFNCEITGTVDSWWQTEDTLYVNDFKYGFNLVEVEKNWQLMSYAFGVLMSHPAPQDFKTIVLSIMQPRPHHEDGWYRSVELSVESLYAYYQELGARVEEYFVNGGVLSTGKHCKYCPGTATACAAFNKSFCAALEFTEQDIQVDKLSNDELDRYLVATERATEILKIKKEALTYTAQSKLNNGEKVGDWRNVESFGNRKWNASFKLNEIELLSGLKLTKDEVMSPAQAEKKGLDKELVKLLTMTESRGFKLENKKVTNKKLSEVFNK